MHLKKATVQSLKKKPQHYIGSYRFKPSGKLTIEVDSADVVE